MKLFKKVPAKPAKKPFGAKSGNPMKPKRPRVEEPDETDNEDGDSDADSFLAQGAEQLKKMRKEQDALNQSSRRPPEVFIVGDGGTVNLRFLRSEPAAIFRYTLPLGIDPRTKRPRFGSFSRPAKGHTDLFQRAGHKPTMRYIYPVIDIEGYVDKETKKRMRNLPRYLVVPQKVYAQLEVIRQKRGNLTSMNIEMTRSGTGTQTTYSFYADSPSDPPKGHKEAREKLVKEMPDYYRPPDEAAQRNILGNVSDEDED